jgi:hypothetical protein
VSFRNKLIFYGEELLVPRPTPKLEEHPLSAVLHCLFNIRGICSCPPASATTAKISRTTVFSVVIMREIGN